MTPVKSSNIAAVEHDGKHLPVQFHSGETWRYLDVPQTKHAAMMTADSVGGYFHTNIRKAHRGEKVVA